MWIAALCASLGATTAARAEFHWGLGRSEAELTFLTDYESQDDQRGGEDYESIVFEERIRLRNTGSFVWDPRLLTLNMSGSFGAPQEVRLSGSDLPLRVGDGTLYDYSFEGLVLADSAYPVTLFATRNQTLLAQGFGGRSDLTFSNFGGTFDLHENSHLESLGWHGLTASVGLRQEKIVEDSSFFGSVFRRNERRRIVQALAHRAGQFSDFDLRYDLNSVDDPLNASNVFDSHTLRVGHSLDFGPTHNRRVDSRLYYFNRVGSSDGSYVSQTETLHIDHHRDFSTDYRYDFSNSDFDAGTATSHGGNVGLLRRFYRNVTTTLDGRAAYQTFPTGDKTWYGGRGGVEYRRGIPYGGEIFLGTHAGYQVDDNNFTSSVIEQPDERHSVPPDVGTGAGFTLVHPFVEEPTIVVVGLGADGNSRFDATLGTDYVIVTEGSRTRIIPLAESPVLRPGDQVSVTYSYNVAPSLTYSTLDVLVRAGVDFSCFGIAYEHTTSNQARLAGESSPGFLIDQDIDRLRLETRLRWRELRVQSTIAYEVTDSTIVDSQAIRFSQSLSYRFSRNLTAEVNGDEYFIDYPDENRRSDSYMARASMDWLLADAFTTTPFVDYRSYHDTAVMNDDILEAGVRMRWTYRKIEISPAFSWTSYRDRMEGVHAVLRITRRFY